MGRRRSSPDLDPVFHALAHGGRRKLLVRLRERGGITLGELCDGFSMTRQAVSQHLEVLERADLVVTRWHGREKLHYLNPTPLIEAQDAFLAPLVTREARGLAALRDALESRESAGRSAARRRKAGGNG